MGTPTARLGLIKPAYGDDQDVQVINASLDVLDLNAGAQPVTSGTMPPSPYNGQIVRQTDTGALAIFNGTTWDYFDTRYQQYTPTVSINLSNITLGNGISTGKYFRQGKHIIVEMFFQLGTTTSYNTITGDMAISLPSVQADLNVTGAVQGVGVMRANGVGGAIQGMAYISSADVNRLRSVIMVGPGNTVANNNTTVGSSHVSAVGNNIHLHADFYVQ